MVRKFRVIIAEDEMMIAKNIAANVSRANEAFEVISIAPNGQDALASVQELLPDVLMSDIKMPVMDGLALIAEVNSKFPSIKTVIFSGYDDFEFVRAALQNNASDYLLKPVNHAELKVILDRLERELLAEMTELSADRNNNPAEVVQRVIDFIHCNYNKPISLSDISSQFGFSLSYLTKIFTVHTGTPPSKYLKEHRMSAAKKLLITSTFPISKIAEKVGYSDQFHFSKTFKNLVGKSPKQFREDSLKLK